MLYGLSQATILFLCFFSKDSLPIVSPHRSPFIFFFSQLPHLFFFPHLVSLELHFSFRFSPTVGILSNLCLCNSQKLFFPLPLVCSLTSPEKSLSPTSQLTEHAPLVSYRSGHFSSSLKNAPHPLSSEHAPSFPNSCTFFFCSVVPPFSVFLGSPKTTPS